MKIYVAGPITGIEDYKEQFAAAEQLLKEKGHTVMNPAILPEGFEHEDYMHICLPMVDVCDAVVLLPGWMDSKGAKAEFVHATGQGIKKYFDVSDVPEVRG